ncbi:MAG: hypothetical protein ACI9QC_000797 [Oceanicoccus sp.]|jgi:hypothetical protein
MAEDLHSTPAQPENNNEAPKMPQIGVVAGPTPVTPAVANKMPQVKSEENVFTQLFGDDKVMQSSNMMETVNKREEKEKKSVFSKKPSLKSIKAKLKTKSKGSLQAGPLLLKVSMLVAIMIGGFFYTQNSVDFSLFGTNSAQKLEIAGTELSDVQAEIHVQKHLTAVLLLDQFSSTADSYLYNLTQSKSSVNSSNKQEEYSEAAEENELEVAQTLLQIQETIVVNVMPDEKIAATVLIGELIASLEARSGEVDTGSLIQDIDDLDTTRSLIQNDDFRSSLAGVNLEELDDEVIEDLLNNYSALNKSKQAVIGSIRNSRIDWSSYFNEIETLTKKVDPLFNTEFPGSLLISDIKFEMDSISISGSTTTDDTKNFTLVSNYIDMLESSSSFYNVEERSYNKNIGTDDYTGSFRISLELENE